MKIVVCPDKFKGTLSATEVAEVISMAISEVCPSTEVIQKAMADGGDGTIELLYKYSNNRQYCKSVDAIMREIDTSFVVINDSIAAIEMSQTVGLAMLDEEFWNPEETSSYGFGLTIRSAIDMGYRDFILAIGGSATNDCGIGMLSALGVVFYDKNLCEVTPTGRELQRIEDIDTCKLQQKIKDCTFTVACDVTNPLFGENGATRIYASQKGADGDMVERLERGVMHFYETVKTKLGINMDTALCAGAAGGVGGAIAGLMGGKLISGAYLLAERVGLLEQIRTADLVVTAEGKIDSQTQNGKLVDVVRGIALENNCKVVAYCGINECGNSDEMDIYPIVDGRITVEESMQDTAKLLGELVKKTINKYL